MRIVCAYSRVAVLVDGAVLDTVHYLLIDAQFVIQYLQIILSALPLTAADERSDLGMIELCETK